MEGQPSTFTFIPGTEAQALGQALPWGSPGPFSSKCNIIQTVMMTSHVHQGPNSPVIIKPPCLVKGEDSSDPCRYAHLRWPSQTTSTINGEKQVLLKHSSEQLKVDTQNQSDALCPRHSCYSALSVKEGQFTSPDTNVHVLCVWVSGWYMVRAVTYQSPSTKHQSIPFLFYGHRHHLVTQARITNANCEAIQEMPSKSRNLTSICTS